MVNLDSRESVDPLSLATTLPFSLAKSLSIFWIFGFSLIFLRDALMNSKAKFPLSSMVFHYLLTSSSKALLGLHLELADFALKFHGHMTFSPSNFIVDGVVS